MKLALVISAVIVALSSSPAAFSEVSIWVNKGLVTSFISQGSYRNNIVVRLLQEAAVSVGYGKHLHLRGYAQILATDQTPASGEDKRPIVRDSSGGAELDDYGDERDYFDNESVDGAFEDSSDTIDEPGGDTTSSSKNDEEPELFKEKKSSLSKESRLALREYANTSLGDGMLLHVKPHIIAAVVRANTVSLQIRAVSTLLLARSPSRTLSCSMARCICCRRTTSSRYVDM